MGEEKEMSTNKSKNKREAEKKKAREMISELDGIIKIYVEAKEALELVCTECNTQNEGWKDSYENLTESSGFEGAKKIDLFEGDMAKKLDSEIASIVRRMNIVSSRVSTVAGRISRQIVALDTKISELRRSRRTWANKL